jgi:hypothetical protein
MGIVFMRSQTEELVWISLPIFGSKRHSKDSVSQHLYTHQIKATMSTIESDERCSIKLRFPTEADEAQFMIYMGLLNPTDSES